LVNKYLGRAAEIIAIKMKENKFKLAISDMISLIIKKDEVILKVRSNEECFCNWCKEEFEKKIALKNFVYRR
jgi:hypothetical protein